MLVPSNGVPLVNTIETNNQRKTCLAQNCLHGSGSEVLCGSCLPPDPFEVDLKNLRNVVGEVADEIFSEP